MKTFTYERARSPADAAAAAARIRGSKFIAGGTNLIDLMKLEIETPTHLVDVNGLSLDKIEPARMRPGLSACVIIRREERPNALLIARAAIAGRNDLKLGPCNAQECVVLP